jgi:tetratricopeptide (TPR) repeat protein
MRAYVLPDVHRLKLAGRFVWLGIDTENPKNSPFVEQFPIDAWPSLLVIDPATETVVVRWAGTATAKDIEKLALDGDRALRAKNTSRADGLLADADRLLGARSHAEAAAGYGSALAAGGSGWAGRERAAEARVQALGMTDDGAECAAAARELLPSVRTPATAARIAAQGLGCALGLEGEGKTAAVAALEPRARALVLAKGVLADDRSWLYDQLASVRQEAGDEQGARVWAEKWLGYLEGEARRGKTPLERAAFNGQRVSAAMRLGQPGRVLAALQASEKELPGDFAPPSLLGVVYLELGKPAESLAAAERALALAQGPRRIRIMVLKAQAETKLERKDAARATLEQALAEGEALGENARPEGYLKRARKMLGELGAG